MSLSHIKTSLVSFTNKGGFNLKNFNLFLVTHITIHILHTIILKIENMLIVFHYPKVLCGNVEFNFLIFLKVTPQLHEYSLVGV